MRSQTLKTVLLICAILVLGWVLLRAQKQPEAKPQALATAIASQLQMISFDAQGQLSQQVYSPNARLYQARKRSEFTQPLMFYYRQNTPPWKVTADHATTYNDFERIVLAPNVRMHQAASANNKATTLTTSTLTVYPKQHVAENTVLTHAEQQGLEVQSMGVKVNFKQGKVVLLHQAMSNYFSDDK